MTVPPDFHELHPGVVGPTVGSLRDFIDIVHGAADNAATDHRDGYDLVYRGVPRTSYGIHSQLAVAIADRTLYAHEMDPPGFHRVTESRMALVEARIMQQARLRGLHVSPSGLLPPAELLAVLRHHGVPARFMDFTSSALTALWFAVADAEHAEHDAMVVLLDAKDRYLDLARFPEPTGQLYTSFENVHPAVRSLPWHSDDHFWDRVETNSRMLAHSRSAALRDQIGFLRTNWRHPDDVDNNYFVWNPGGLDPRMVRQRGSFVFGRTKLDPGWSSLDVTFASEETWREHVLRFAMPQPSFAGVVHIPRDHKPRIAFQLQAAHGIDQRHLFPDPSGLAEWIRDPENFAELAEDPAGE